MPSVPFIKFFPSDWSGGCAHLSEIEEFVYFKICLHNWNSGKPISERILRRVLKGAAASMESALSLLIEDEKIQKNEVGFYNMRALDAHSEAQNRKKDAEKAAHNRWKNKKKIDNARAT